MPTVSSTIASRLCAHGRSKGVGYCGKRGQDTVPVALATCLNCKAALTADAEAKHQRKR